MKIVNSKWGIQIDFDICRIRQLVIESPKYLSNVLAELKGQSEGGYGQFVLSENNKELKLSEKMELILDPFDLNLNNKKVLTKLYKDLQEILLDEVNYKETNEVLCEVRRLLGKANEESEHMLDYSDENRLEELFKAFDVRLYEENCDLMQQILEYCDVMQKYCKTDVFIFVNLKSYVCEEDLEEMYVEFIYKQINVLLIEQVERKRLKLEVTQIIDKDLCEI